MTLVTIEGETLAVRPWMEAGSDDRGYDPRSPYVERFWLSVIGPSATWLMRRIAAGFDAAPAGFEMPLGDTARALGLGDKGGRNSAFFRTINRLVQFELGRVRPDGSLEVLRRLPPLPRRHVARLSPTMQEAHARWMEESRRGADGEAAMTRARRLSLSLLELGEGAEAIETQLLRWRYNPALARDAVCWAVDRHRRAVAASTITQPADSPVDT